MTSLNSATFYTVGSDGVLAEKATVRGGFGGITGGYFALDKVTVLHHGNQNCAYMTQSVSGQVTGIVVSTLKIAGTFFGSSNDFGMLNGVGVTANSNYLYASFTSSNTIGTFQVQSGCKLKFLGDIDVIGLNGGSPDGMKLNGHILVVTYLDGSVESFDIANGIPVSNGDRQITSGFRSNNLPGGVDITKDGHFAIFGDLSTSTVVEVSDISSGKLTQTTVFHLGSARNSDTIWLSPDESLLYIANSQGGRITVAFFDKSTGKLSKGCTSPSLRGFDSQWVYLGNLVTQNNSGTGGVVYVAEFGNPSSIGGVRANVNGGKCTVKEIPKSPFSDPQSPGLLSIGSIPPRAF